MKQFKDPFGAPWRPATPGALREWKQVCVFVACFLFVFPFLLLRKSSSLKIWAFVAGACWLFAAYFVWNFHMLDQFAPRFYLDEAGIHIKYRNGLRKKYCTQLFPWQEVQQVDQFICRFSSNTPYTEQPNAIRCVMKGYQGQLTGCRKVEYYAEQENILIFENTPEILAYFKENCPIPITNRARETLHY